MQYKLPHEDLPNVTLLLNMWNWEIMGRNKFLGEFKLPLSSRDLDLSDSEDKIYTLKVSLDSAQSNNAYYINPPPHTKGDKLSKRNVFMKQDKLHL